jgi:hypothetical protein
VGCGYNGDGELGNGTTEDSSVPVEVSGLSEVVSVSAGIGHGLALLSDGTVMSWGDNQAAQLGNGSCCEQSDLPVKVSGLSEATAVASGLNSLAMLRDGTVVDWGVNSSGQLGNGTSSGPETCTYLESSQSCSKTPVAVSSLSGATAIAAGQNYALAVGQLPSNSQIVDSGNSLNAVSCVPGTTECVASDSQGNAFYASEVKAGSPSAWKSWSGPGVAPSEAVECPTSSLCLLAAGSASGYGGNLYYATSRGGSFTGAVFPSYGVDAISCPSASFCVEGQDGGGYFRYSTSPASSSWTLEQQGSAAMKGVDCLSSSFCAMVDGVGTVHVATKTSTVESSSWTTTKVDGSTAVSGVACTSTTSCLAVDVAGNVLRLTIGSGGEATASTKNIDGGNRFTAITCTASSTCVAVDNQGNVFVSGDQGESWNMQYTTGAELTGVSCLSSSLCVAGDTTGKLDSFVPN